MELDGWSRGFQPESPEDPSFSQQLASPSNETSPLSPSPPAPKTSGYSDDSAYDSDSDPSLAQNELLDQFQSFCLTPNPRRYFGKSSGVSLVRSAVSAKSKASNGESPRVDTELRVQRRKDLWGLRPVSIPFFLFRIFLTVIKPSGNAIVCSPPSEPMTSLNQNSLPACSRFTSRT